MRCWMCPLEGSVRFCMGIGKRAAIRLCNILFLVVNGSFNDVI